MKSTARVLLGATGLSLLNCAAMAQEVDQVITEIEESCVEEPTKSGLQAAIVDEVEIDGFGREAVKGADNPLENIHLQNLMDELKKTDKNLTKVTPHVFGPDNVGFIATDHISTNDLLVYVPKEMFVSGEDVIESKYVKYLLDNKLE